MQGIFLPSFAGLQKKNVKKYSLDFWQKKNDDNIIKSVSVFTDQSLPSLQAKTTAKRAATTNGFIFLVVCLELEISFWQNPTRVYKTELADFKMLISLKPNLDWIV